MDRWLQIESVASLPHYLLSIPQEQWNDRDRETRSTFLHCACRRNDYIAARLLIKAGVDVNATTIEEVTAMSCALRYGNVKLIKLIYANGGSFRMHEYVGNPIDFPLCRHDFDMVYFLISNGVRLRTNLTNNIPPWIMSSLRAHEKQFLAIRTAICSLFSLKKHLKDYRWDRFLLHEIAFEVWKSR